MQRPENGAGITLGEVFGLELGQYASAPRAFDLVYLDPPKLRFSYVGETLTLSMDDGTFLPHVTLRRCFPLSKGDIMILVRRPQGEDEHTEIGVIADISQLDEESQETVKRELRLHYFVPVIRKVVSIREEFGFLYWLVDTDRGTKEFIMR